MSIIGGVSSEKERTYALKSACVGSHETARKAKISVGWTWNALRTGAAKMFSVLCSSHRDMPASEVLEIMKWAMFELAGVRSGVWRYCPKDPPTHSMTCLVSVDKPGKIRLKLSKSSFTWRKIVPRWSTTQRIRWKNSYKRRLKS